MLFNTYEFLFGFLPLALLAFHVTRILVGGQAAMAVALAFSLFFYGWWNPPYLLLLVGSVAVNYGFARHLALNPSRAVLGLGIFLNLSLLGYFKYRNFFMENVGLLLGENWDLGAVFIPLAISFYTFQQIALLIDIRNHATEPPSPLEFGLFVIFFPQLIIGPIVLYREMREQFGRLQEGAGPGLALFGPGIVVFAVGLFKKLALADAIGVYADFAFGSPAAMTMLEAWAGTLAYMLQLYFDFSGYADMAIGLGLMFGIRLPLNFDTPYAATSMIDFWRRWHITLHRFLRDYLYIPLGGSRHGTGTQILVVMVVFFLSGLWHGPAWTFIMLGVINGAGVSVNLAWRAAKLPALPPLLGWVLTLTTIMVSFVYFRSPDMATAHTMFARMFLPEYFFLPNWLSGTADTFGLPWRTLVLFASGSYTLKLVLWIVVLAPLSMFMPNIAKEWEALLPRWRIAAATGLMYCVAIGWLERPQAFIYFQF